MSGNNEARFADDDEDSSGGGIEITRSMRHSLSLGSSFHSATNSNVDEELLKRHKRHGSRHAMEFNRIMEDSQMQTRHKVPELSPNQSASVNLAQLPSAEAGTAEATTPVPFSLRFRRRNNNNKTNNDKKKIMPIRLPPPQVIASKTQRLWTKMVPLPNTLRTYSCHKFQHDFVAGVTVAILAIPLGMSYARLAGLPAYFGLYASFVPPLVYPIFGTTPQLGVGPAALLSLLLSQGVGNIVERDYPEVFARGDLDAEYIAIYTGLAIQCTFLAGLFNLAMGIFRLGFLTQFLSRAVISGFTSGAAIVICASQVQHILGVSIPSSNKLHIIVGNLIKQLAVPGKFNWQSFLLGVGCILFIVGTKHVALNERVRTKYPRIKWLRALSPIVVSIFAMLLVLVATPSIKLVDPIPAGLPSITVGTWTDPIHPDLWVLIISMVVVGFVQSISISKRLGYRRGYDVDPSQELVALGLANLVGSMFQAYPTSGAMGQSAVNDEIGAETGVTSIVTGLVVMCVLLFMTPIFEYMPLAVLASIVIAFVWSMVDYPEVLYLLKVHKFDCAVWIAAFLGVMFLGLIDGLGIAVGISLLIVLWESAYPHTAELGRLPGTMLYRNIVQYSEAERYDGLVIVRIDAPIYFMNANNVRDKIRRYKRKAQKVLDKQRQRQADSAATAAAAAIPSPSTNGDDDVYNNNNDEDVEMSPPPPGVAIATDVQYIILELSPVSRIDTTGLHMLEDMYTTQKQLDTELCLCNPSLEVTARLVQSGLAEKVGSHRLFPSVIDAVQWCLHDMDSRLAEEEAHGVEEVGGSANAANAACNAPPAMNSNVIDTASGSAAAEEP